MQIILPELAKMCRIFATLHVVYACDDLFNKPHHTDQKFLEIDAEKINYKHKQQDQVVVLMIHVPLRLLAELRVANAL